MLKATIFAIVVIFFLIGLLLWPDKQKASSKANKM